MAEAPGRAATMFTSVMDIFKPKPAQTQVTAASGNTTVPNDNTLQNIEGTGPKAIPKAGEGEASPLAQYGKLWETADTDGKPIQLVPPMTADPVKLLEAAKTVDFTKAMRPEVLEAAAKGDAVALGTLVNEAAQAGYAQSAMATTKILEAALKKQADMFQKEVMPEILRRHSISQVNKADNPVFDNPAVKPMLDGLEAQLAVKYPTATAADISKHAKTILSGMAEDIVKQSGRTIAEAPTAESLSNSNARKEPDWEKLFGVAPLA